MEMFGLIFAFLMLMAFSILLSVAVGFTTRRRPKRLAFTLSALVAPTLLVSLWLTGCYTLQEAHSVMGRKHFWFFEGVCPLVNGYDFTFDAKFNTGYIAKHGVELSRPPVWDIGYLQVATPYVVGQLGTVMEEPGKFFLFDTVTGTVEHFDSIQELQARVGHTVTLKAPSDFYAAAR